MFVPNDIKMDGFTLIEPEASAHLSVLKDSPDDYNKTLLNVVSMIGNLLSTDFKPDNELYEKNRDHVNAQFYWEMCDSADAGNQRAGQRIVIYDYISPTQDVPTNDENIVKQDLSITGKFTKPFQLIGDVNESASTNRK